MSRRRRRERELSIRKTPICRGSRLQAPSVIAGHKRTVLHFSPPHNADLQSPQARCISRHSFLLRGTFFLYPRSQSASRVQRRMRLVINENAHSDRQDCNARKIEKDEGHEQLNTPRNYGTSTADMSDVRP